MATMIPAPSHELDKIRHHLAETMQETLAILRKARDIKLIDADTYYNLSKAVRGAAVEVHNRIGLKASFLVPKRHWGLGLFAFTDAHLSGRCSKGPPEADTKGDRNAAYSFATLYTLAGP